MEIKVLDQQHQKLLQGTLIIGGISDIAKELIQNAIDAKATQIKVILKFDLEGKCVNVICEDDGVGIPLNDMKIVGKRYHTSKLPGQSETLGYRGQALNSIINISTACMISSKTEKDSMMSRILFSREAGNVSRTLTTEKQEDTSCSMINWADHGTRVYAYDVFGSVPVRKHQIFRHDMHQQNRKFHKVYSEIRRITLDSCAWKPSISLLIEIESGNQTRRLMNISGGVLGRLKHAVNLFRQIYGKNAMRNYSEVGNTKDGVDIQMAIGSALVDNKRYRIIYLNGRPLTEGDIYDEIQSRVRSKAPDGNFSFITFIECNRVHYNVSLGSLRGSATAKVKKEIRSMIDELAQEYFSKQNSSDRCLHLKSDHYDLRRIQKLPESRLFARSKYFSDTCGLEISKLKAIQNLTVVNQVDRKFILCKITNQDGEYLVAFDQHACQERINLEKIYQEMFEMNFKCKLDNPLRMQLNEEAKDELVDFQETLEFWGIKTVKNGGNYYIIELPEFVIKAIDTKSVLCPEKIESEICQFMEDLASGRKVEVKVGVSHNWWTLISQMPKLWCSILKKKSCSISTKFGEKLTKESCQMLIRQLFECQDPFHYAHGRTTMYPLCRL
ncbi:hypothetical protein HII12_005221 [Brettanomyces bruxellensis]|uniref:MutL C-terminal dimerisation domain-containing protein n=1 Tax=Dekkera bruxellensis TaxID=5007 RepID=A0A8H6B6A7_DEKBR|nr:hypothetical protein HII12_005221 [Brettanomyces bruxellensis]